MLSNCPMSDALSRYHIQVQQRLLLIVVLYQEGYQMSRQAVTQDRLTTIMNSLKISKICLKMVDQSSTQPQEKGKPGQD